MPSSGRRAAASSIASGMPSSRRQISATACVFSGVSAKRGSTDSARATNSSIAPVGGASASPHGVGGGHGERAEAVHVLVRSLQRLLAGDQHAQPRRGCAQRVDERRDVVGEMLAVVERQQHPLWREHGGDGVGRRSIRAEHRVQNARHRRRHQRAIGQRRQLDPPDAVRKVGRALDGELRGHGLRDARLADAAGAGDGQHHVSREQRLDRLDVRRPAVQRRQT